MVAAAWIWKIGSGRMARVAASRWRQRPWRSLRRSCAKPLAVALPDPVEWYCARAGSGDVHARSVGRLPDGRGTGRRALDAARGPAEQERQLHAGLFVAAAIGILGGYGASLLPSIYANAQFWTSSPTFFFIRLGIVVLFIPSAWLFGLSPGSRWLRWGGRRCSCTGFTSRWSTGPSRFRFDALLPWEIVGGRRRWRSVRRSTRWCAGRTAWWPRARYRRRCGC